MNQKLLRAKEVASWFNSPVERIYALAREGIIPSVRLGRQLRFDRKAMEKFIENGGQALAGGWKKDF